MATAPYLSFTACMIVSDMFGLQFESTGVLVRRFRTCIITLSMSLPISSRRSVAQGFVGAVVVDLRVHPGHSILVGRCGSGWHVHLPQ